MQRALGVSLLRSSLGAITLARTATTLNARGNALPVGAMGGLVRGMASVGLDSLAPAKGSTHQVCMSFWDWFGDEFLSAGGDQCAFL
jgi:hypothetical protein